MHKDIYSNIDGGVSVAPQFVNSNTTLTGDAVDTRGYEGAVALLISGTMAGTSAQNVYTPELQESDSSGTGFTAVADADLISTEALCVHTGATDKLVKRLGYKGVKRYLRLVITTTAFTTAGGNIAGVIVRGAPHTAALAQG